MGGLVECFLTFKVGYLIKRGVYFESRINFNMPLLISKSENVISCQWRCLPFRQQLSKWLALFPDVINIQKRRRKRSYQHGTQKLKRLVGKTIPSTRVCLQTMNSAIS